MERDGFRTTKAGTAHLMF